MNFLFRSVILLIGLFIVIPNESESANILFYQLIGSVSHKISIWPLARELSLRGHNVTFVTLVKVLEEIDGLIEIDPTIQQEMTEAAFETNAFMDRVKGKFTDGVLLNWPSVSLTACEQFLKSPKGKTLLTPEANGKSRFDMVIVDPCRNDCIFGPAYLHGSIIVNFVTTGFYPFNTQYTDAPNPTPYKGAYGFHYPDNTRFTHRVLAVIDTAIFLLTRHLYEYPKYNELMKKYVGSDIPRVQDIEKSVSFTFLNTHFAVDYPTPLTPSVMEVACLHCKPAKNITDENLKKFLDESDENGFIFFSLGSFVSETQMPEEYQLKILNAFSRLKQRVVWKWSGDHLKGKIPSNVLLRKWIPQNDMLGHPKVRLFISHGGKLSTEETLYHGVPVIVMPMFTDQELHAHLANIRGYGKKFDASQILDGDTFFETITEIVDDKNYKSNALKWSSILRDQQNDPLEKAVYWIEYLLRHNGAQHLQSNVKELNYFQYYLIDVYAFLLGILLFSLTVLFFILRAVIRICFPAKKTKKE